ncbi:MAG: SDR family NAD(P)-dependent oxidoreductase [Acidimicrobiales bacterium]|nr:SDR family NAD(P)-dependent oxidoreductase [Acidimicrobiales bacterium]
MKLEGKVVVVTGGGGGIGEAMARAFAAESARAVVVADIDGDEAERVVADIDAATGVPAVGARVDAGDEADVAELVRRTELAFGPVDLFCANAGIMVVGGVEAPDEAWERIWRVNVASHIYAARAVLPGMLARGSGYLLHTASAAGLLTQLGSAPYSVTKHAVVGLAEWLSITHGDAGVRVSCLCPQAVETAMTGGARAGGRRAGDGASGAARDGILAPAEVARAVVAGLDAEQFLILPHPEVATYEQRRAGDRERWLRGMRRAQAAMVAAWRALASDAPGDAAEAGVSASAGAGRP